MNRVSSGGLLDENGDQLTDYSGFNAVLDYVTLMICKLNGPTT